MHGINYVRVDINIVPEASEEDEEDMKEDN